MFLKIGVLKDFASFSGKHLHWKTPALQAFRSATWNFIKKRLQHKDFPVKCLRAPFSTKQPMWLLFKQQYQSVQRCFSNISYTQSTLITWNSHNDKLIRKTHWLTRFTQTAFLLKSDLNVNNFTVILHFLIT